MKKANNWLILTALAACFLLAGCSKEEWDPAGEEKGEKIPDVGISLTLPFTEENTSLRSIGESEENTIQTLDVLSFRVGSDGKDYFDYHAEGRFALDNVSGAKTQKFRFAAWTRTHQQRFVVITNAREKVTGLLSAFDWKGKEKNTMLASLEAALGTDKKWNAISASDYTAFPMWGEAEPTVISFGTLSIGQIQLLRMVAKIDVQLDQTKPVINKFKLKSVRLYNAYTKGSIVPASLATPTIPATAERYEGPVLYKDFSAPGQQDLAIRNSIYLFESPKTEEHLEATCLVIGGLYENDTEETYYRVDFLNDDGITHKDILRNYKYTVNITDVLDRGHKDEREAFESQPENMEAEVEVWSEDDLAIAFNGQYWLTVSQNLFDFTREACTTPQTHNLLFVNTNYETSIQSGWRIDDIIYPGASSNWLTVTDYESGRQNKAAYGRPNDKATLYLTYTQNTTGMDRRANIIFAAGRLRYRVEVIQTIREGVSITFYSNKITDPHDPHLIPNNEIDTVKFVYPVNDPNNHHADSTFTFKWTPSHVDGSLNGITMYETHKYMFPFMGYNRILKFTTNPLLREVSSEDGIGSIIIGVEYGSSPEDRENLRQTLYYAQSAIEFHVTNGVETLKKRIVFVCYPPNP